MTSVDAFAPEAALAAALLPHSGVTDDGAHDAAHLHRVWRNALAIQQVEGGDTRVLAAAVLLHDCVAVEKDSPLRSQASRLAAARAAELLQALGWAGDAVGRVRHAIEAHSFSAQIPPETLEARILQDADRLDAIGLVGVARCFYTAGRMGSALYSVDDPQGTSRELDDRRYALDHFPRKLLTLAQGFQTPTGRMLAAERHARIASFLSTFLDEI